MSRAVRELVVVLVAAVALLLVPVHAAQAAPVHHRGWRWSVLALLNRERAAHGLRPLVMNSILSHAARAHDLGMAHRNHLDHYGFAQRWDRVARAGYDWEDAGENAGYNMRMTLAGALQLQRAFMASPEHRANILGPLWHEIGVWIIRDRRHHTMWITEEFGATFAEEGNA